MYTKIKGSVYIPLSILGEERVDYLKKRLTFEVKSFHPSEENKKVVTYWEDLDSRCIRVPYFFGIGYLKSIRSPLELDVIIEDGENVGKSPQLPDPKHPLAPANQDRFFDDLHQAAEKSRTVLAVAPTGSGKTAAALYVHGVTGRAMLIVVPSKEMALQWKREAKKHLGYTDDDIGSLEEGKCVYLNKKIVVAVIHNIFQRRLSQGFRAYFGIVVWDEAHRLGAQMFSTTFNDFAAKTRIGLTATPTRKDGLSQVVFDCFGPPSVVADNDAIPCQVRVVNFPTHMPQWKYVSRAAMISKLTEDVARNESICKIIKTLYDKGRNILVLSDRIQHLQALGKLLISQGVDSPDIGLYTRSFYDKEGKKHNFTEDELANVRNNCRIIMGTYGMSKEAVDIPRLDAGVDATPRADGIQAIGRIRRPMLNKRLPVWFTIRDITIPPLVGLTISRIKDYKTSQTVEVIDHG